MMRNQGGNYATIVYIDGMFEPAKRLAKTANNKRFAEQYHRLESTSTLEKNETHIMDNRSRIAVIRDGDSFPNDIDAEYYVLEDHLGSGMLRLKSTAGGTVLDREEYYPFGDSSLRIWTKKRYQYVGKEKDAESGLYYYGARSRGDFCFANAQCSKTLAPPSPALKRGYYAAWTCRFISVDPLAAKYPSLNPYLYAYNNPVRANDPTGMEGEEGQTSNDSGNGDKVTGSSGQYSGSNEGVDPNMNSLQGDTIPEVRANKTTFNTPSSIDGTNNLSVYEGGLIIDNDNPNGALGRLTPRQDKAKVDLGGLRANTTKGGASYNPDWQRLIMDIAKLIRSGNLQIYGDAADSSKSPGRKIGLREDAVIIDFGQKNREVLEIIVKAYSNKMVNNDEIKRYNDLREDAVDQLDIHGYDGEKLISNLEATIWEEFTFNEQRYIEMKENIKDRINEDSEGFLVEYYNNEGAKITRPMPASDTLHYKKKYQVESIEKMPSTR